MTTNAIGDPGTVKLQHRRPVGVWLLTVCHTVYAGLGIWGWGELLLGPLPHGWSPTAVEQAPYMVGLFAALLASAWWVWLGHGRARVLLLGLLTVVVGFSIREVVVSIAEIVDERGRSSELWSSAVQWGAGTGLALSMWLFLNFWYLLGRRTRDFFRD